MIANRVLHDERTVHLLQHAHADQIESVLTGLSAATSPGQVFELRTVDGARVFLSSEVHWENRAILRGGESDATLNTIVDHFDRYRQRCHIELHAANFRHDLGLTLLARGFRLHSIRCVWAAPCASAPDTANEETEVRTYTGPAVDELIDGIATVEGTVPEAMPRLEWTMRAGKSSPQWRHYLAYVNGRPAATASLFHNGVAAYLAWGCTHPEFRGRGLHARLIRERWRDGRSLGCEVAFSVSDFGIASARNLHRVGFGLAYNYFMLYRDPPPSAV